MKKIKSLILLITMSTFVGAQYISEVLEYTPAPGQHINTTWGSPDAAHSIEGSINGMVSLGSFGGTIVFRFEKAVENHPDNPFGVDFTIFGNPLTHWSEHGIVWVMNDQNENGKPDDTWYELAGSDYFLSSSARNYQVTYENPGGTVAQEVAWTDNQGGSGTIGTSGHHSQSYYPSSDVFPQVGAERYTLSGSMILGSVDHSDPFEIQSLPKPFGYADNHPRGEPPYTMPDNPYTPESEYSGGDAFDINWAVDVKGAYVDLEEIHFVKVQTAVLDHGGWLGEVSTEITGAADVEPDPSIHGITDFIGIKTLPDTIEGDHFQMEAYVYNQGRIARDDRIIWTTDLPGVNVVDNMITFTSSGHVTLTGATESDPLVTKSISTYLEYQDVTGGNQDHLAGIRVYPNPVDRELYVESTGSWHLRLFNSAGIEVISCTGNKGSEAIELPDLSSGIYFARLLAGNRLQTLQLLKQ